MNMTEFLQQRPGVANDPEQHKTAWIELRDYRADDYAFRRVTFVTICSAGPKAQGEATEAYHDESTAWDAYWRALGEFVGDKKGVLRWRMAPQMQSEGGKDFFVISRVVLDEVDLVELV